MTVFRAEIVNDKEMFLLHLFEGISSDHIYLSFRPLLVLSFAHDGA